MLSVMLVRLAGCSKSNECSKSKYVSNKYLNMFKECFKYALKLNIVHRAVQSCDVRLEIPFY